MANSFVSVHDWYPFAIIRSSGLKYFFKDTSASINSISWKAVTVTVLLFLDLFSSITTFASEVLVATRVP